MNKQMIRYMFLALTLVSAAFATDKRQSEDEEDGMLWVKSKFVDLDDVHKVISITDLTTEMSQQIYLGLCPNIAIEYPAGAEIPFKFKGKIDFAFINLDPNLSVKLEKTSYFRFVKINSDDNRVRIFTSFDLKKWRKSGSAGGKEIFNIHQDTDKKLVIQTLGAPKN